MEQKAEMELTPMQLAAAGQIQRIKDNLKNGVYEPFAAKDLKTLIWHLEHEIVDSSRPPMGSLSIPDVPAGHISRDEGKTWVKP